MSQDQVWLLSFFVTLGKSLLLWTGGGIGDLAEVWSPWRRKLHQQEKINATLAQSPEAQTSQAWLLIMQPLFLTTEPANCWQSVGFPGNILKAYEVDSDYRCGWTVFLALCTVRGNILYAGHLHTTKQGPLSHTVSKCPIRHSWRTDDIQNILQLVW